MKINTHKLIAAILLATLFASCNTGNKVVSSVGKRKYTKGYYLLSSHKKPELPVIAENKVSKENHTFIIANTSSLNSSAIIVPEVKERKTDKVNHPEIRISKVTNKAVNNSLGNTSQSSQNIGDDGVPGHGDVSAPVSGKHDNDAIAGFALSLAVIPLSFLFGLGLVLIIPALIFSIIGLKSENKHSLAVIGLVLSIIELLILLLAIVVIVLILSTI